MILTFWVRLWFVVVLLIPCLAAQIGPAAAAGTPKVVVATSGPVTDPGGAFVMLVNNSSAGYTGIGYGGITFNAPMPTPGMQRIYRQASLGYPFTNLGLGPMVIQMPVGASVDLAGENSANPANFGTALAAPALVSAGAIGESIYLCCDVAGHWMASVWSGTWVNAYPPPLPVQNPTGVWSTGTTYTVTIAAAAAGVFGHEPRRGIVDGAELFGVWYDHHDHAGEHTDQFRSILLRIAD
jgi:hypothetical protein